MHGGVILFRGSGTERARLLGRAERFEVEAARLEDAATVFARHKKTHDAESQEHARLLADKTQIAEEARQEITARIAALATADGRDLTDAQARLTVQVYGVERARQLHGTFRIPSPAADAKHARQRAAEARKIIAELDARPIVEAAEWLASRQEQRVENETLAARRAALSPDEATATRNKDRERPGLGL